MDLFSKRHSGCIHRRCSMFGVLALSVMVLLQGHLASAAISSVEFESLVASSPNLKPFQLELMLQMSPQQLKTFARRLSPQQQRLLAKRLSPTQVTLFERAGVRSALVAAGSKQKNKMYIDLKTLAVTWYNNAEEAAYRKQLEDRVAAGENVFYPRSACLRGKMEFVRIPRGTFMMGSRRGEEDRMIDEQQHEVELTHDYWMGCFEVTHEQWRAIMGRGNNAKGGVTGALAKAFAIGMPTGDGYPKYNVNQEEAMQFCRKLTNKVLASKANVKAPFPENMEFTLPTEAQWEFACRAGTDTPFYSGEVLLARDSNYRIVLVKQVNPEERFEMARKIRQGGLAGMSPQAVAMILRSSGLSPREIALIMNARPRGSNQNVQRQETMLDPTQNSTKEPQTTKRDGTIKMSTMQLVGQCHPNDFGLYDMHGNMWEWCRGMYYQYPQEGVKAVDPQGGAAGTIGVARGGSWYSFDEDCRSARRLDIFREARQNNIGFRVILAVKRH